MGPVSLEPGVIIDQAQQAKPTKAQTEFIKNLVRLTERSSWEVGKGSGSHVLAEKIMKLSPSTGELGGDLPRTDGFVDEFLTHVSSAGPQISEGSDSHSSAEKLLLVSPSTSEMGGVLPRSDGCGDEFGAVGGPSVGPKSSGAEVGCMGDTVLVADGPAEDFPNFRTVLNPMGSLSTPSPLFPRFYWFLNFPI